MNFRDVGSIPTVCTTPSHHNSVIILIGIDGENELRTQQRSATECIHLDGLGALMKIISKLIT